MRADAVISHTAKKC